MIRTPSLSHPKSRLLRAMLMLALIASSPYVLQAADGALDVTFGKEGQVRTDFLGGSYDVAFGVAVQADCKIVAVGTAVGPTPQFAVARYNRDGSLDLTFGDGGKVLTEFPNAYSAARAMAIQADGRIVVVGRRWVRWGSAPTSPSRGIR